jgi:hypothetical protein
VGAARCGQLGSLACLVTGALGGATNADRMVGPLPFRTIADRLIDRLDLLGVQDSELRLDAREKLRGNHANGSLDGVALSH